MSLSIRLYNGSAAPVGLQQERAENLPLSVIHVPRRFVTNEWGGTETTILQTCRELNRRGHSNSIFTTTALCEQTREELQGIRVRRHAYNYPFWGLSASARRNMDKKGGNLLSLPMLGSLLRERNLDLLHAHAGKRLGGIVRTAARLRGIPYVISLHGGVVDVPVEEMNELLKPLEGTFEWGRAVGALLGARRVLEDADAIICVGDNERRAVQARHPDKRVVWLPNGVDSERFVRGNGARFRQAYGIPEQRKILLSVSRIDYQKNQIALVESLTMLLRQKSDLHLVLIGPITVESYGEQLAADIEARGLGNRVTIIPGLPGDSQYLLDAYHAASVFCLPSRHEPFGIVILEAWAAGLPVVASAVGGIPGFTRDGIDILHADPDNPASFSNAIQSLLDRPEQAERLSKCGQSRARTEFDWTRIADRLESLYREMVRL
jgi:glycosyltransferase involved in cell wall biosynthesis